MHVGRRVKSPLVLSVRLECSVIDHPSCDPNLMLALEGLLGARRSVPSFIGESLLVMYLQSIYVCTVHIYILVRY
jgi:hypothetical protein